MTAQPSGTITFLFTDIEGSSRLWEEYPEAMRVALAKHDNILRVALESHGGFIFKTVGDAFCVAFDTAADGATAAVQGQRTVVAERWDGIDGIKVRMALHTGAAERRDGDYFGQALNRVSRILAAAHGGQILLSLATEELVRDSLPEGVRLRDLGERRLRDLARPENIFQLIATDLPTEFPPLRSLESVPNNLPIELTSFIGREREMAEVKRLLGSTHLLTLTGTGGTGKTRLSLQLGADLLERFSDGVWLVEFATIDDAALVVETVASVLNVRQETDRPLASTLANFLRAKSLLLIFDNCEHVVAACAHLADMLLRACRNLVILASSREPLGIGGEIAWPLPPLSLPDHWREIATGPGAVERVMQYEAVRLFVERTVAVRPSFQLTDASALAVAQICWRLDGIPLAIELAAARARVLRVDQIAERLDDRFHLLTGGSRTAVPRQQTLRALIDWSYDLLGDLERRLLRRLSVFGRGRTLEAIEAVCSCDGLERWQIIDLLTQLVDKSLLTVERTEGHDVRYFMIESVWDYSREKLAEAGETDAIRERHLDFFLKFAEDFEEKIIGPDQQKWLERLAEDGTNLRFALETSLELQGQTQKGLRLVSATQRFVEVRGLFKEALDVIAQLLAHPDAAPRNAARANALAAAGRLAWMVDDSAASGRWQEEALGIYRELGDGRCAAKMLADLALSAWDRGEAERAPALIEEAAELAAPFREDSRLRAHLLRSRALLSAGGRDFTESMALYEQALALYRELGDQWMARIAQWAVGVTATVLGRYEEARTHFTECLKGSFLGNRMGLAYMFEAFAALAVAEQQYERAARLLGAAEALRAKHGVSTEPGDHPAVREILASAAEHFAKEEFGVARREGRAMSVDDAVAFALSS